jgi:hypothetical protein
MFLCTPVVSLILGGAGTVSASTMESWGCFFCLSITSFFGYLMGRVALIDGARNKRAGFSTILLSRSILCLLCFWLAAFVLAKWDVPVSLIVIRTEDTKLRPSWSSSAGIRKLQ